MRRILLYSGLAAILIVAAPVVVAFGAVKKAPVVAKNAVKSGLKNYADKGQNGGTAGKDAAIEPDKKNTIPPADAEADNTDKRIALEYMRSAEMSKIRRLFLNGRYALMEKPLAAFREKYPVEKDKDYYYYLGAVLEAKGEYRWAVESYLQAIHIEPENSQARNSLASLYCRLHKYHFAMNHFQRALEINPYNPFVQYNTGNLYFEIGDMEKARLHLEKAVEYKRNFGSAYYKLGLLMYQTQRYKDAIDYFTKAMNFKRESHTTHYYIGLSYFNLEKGSLAIASLKKALQIKADFFEAAFELGRVYHSYGEFANAVEYYRKAEALNPDYGELKLCMIECFRELRKYREGIAIARQVLEREPDNERARRYMKNLQEGRLIENLSEPYDYYSY